MRVLVTGATGYVGTNLVARLSRREGYEVHALLRPTSDETRLREHLPAEVLHRVPCQQDSILQLFQQVRPDVVVHLAAAMALYHKPSDVQDLMQGNLSFGTYLLEAITQTGPCGFVNTGTFWERSAVADSYWPFNLYAATKKAFRDILRFYEIRRGIPAVTLRLFGTYGPHDWRGKIFSLFRRSLTCQEPIPLSPGEQLLDLVYIEDVLDAYLRAISFVQAGEGAHLQTFDVGSGESRSLRDIADIYQNCVGRPLNVRWGALPYRKGEILIHRPQLERARDRLGWSPRYTLETGIAALVEAEAGGGTE